jgi:hypothetical protein
MLEPFAANATALLVSAGVNASAFGGRERSVGSPERLRRSPSPGPTPPSSTRRKRNHACLSRW